MSNRYNRPTRLVESFEEFTGGLEKSLDAHKERRKPFDNDDDALKGEYLPILRGDEAELESRFEQVVSTIVSNLEDKTIKQLNIEKGIKSLLKKPNDFTLIKNIFNFKDGSSLSVGGQLGLMDDYGRYIYYGSTYGEVSADGEMAKRIKIEIELLSKFYVQGYDLNKIVWEVFNKIGYIPKRSNTSTGKY